MKALIDSALCVGFFVGIPVSLIMYDWFKR
jgi:hypothetical protein